MFRLSVIAIVSLVLFFPAYWILHPLAGPEIGAWSAVGLMFIGLPVLLLRLWRVRPPLFAVPVEPGDPDMRQCIRRSRSEIHRFKEGLNEGKKNAFVKYPVRTQDNGKEHVWGMAHALDGDQVIVSLVNETIDPIDEMAADDPRTKIAISELEDWILVDKDGNCEGGYTHLALYKIYRKLYGKVPKAHQSDMEAFVDIDPSEYA